MGLNQGDAHHPVAALARRWSLPVTVLAVAGVLALWGDAGREALSYNRGAIAAGEVWRLASGHLAHLGWSHFLLNAAGLIMTWYLVGAGLSGARWVLVMVAIVGAIDAGFWFLNPGLDWYVGLSGLLHGMLIAGAVACLRQGHRDAWLIVGLVALKLGYEQLVGPLPGSESSSGGPVIVAAHLYGALAGAAAGILLPDRVKATAPI